MNKRNLKSHFISMKSAEYKRIKLDNENDGNQGADLNRDSKPSRKNVNSNTFICKNFAKKKKLVSSTVVML